MANPYVFISYSRQDRDFVERLASGLRHAGVETWTHFSRDIGTPVFLLKIRDPGPTLAIEGMTHIDFLSAHRDGFAKLDAEMKRKGL
jgi:hypothetical protein